MPAKLRRELGMESGGRLLIRVENGSLILEPRKVVERRLHERFHPVDPKVSLAESLVADRRAEAAREVAVNGLTSDDRSGDASGNAVD